MTGFLIYNSEKIIQADTNIRILIRKEWYL